MLNNQSLLITGGTGSFGMKCTEILLKEYSLRRLIIFSRDELKQYEMEQRFSVQKYPQLRYFIGDVRDKERLYRALDGVDYIIHAAAMKQVPTAEYNPTECIHTNVGGAENIINVASDSGVKKVVALSTDKAVSPINLYGASKLCSDKLFVAANRYIGKTVFSVVRYGNVLGSRGSVVPFFIQKRNEGGPIPITDPHMTRFWITLEQGVRMVLRAFELSTGGEIFVPKIPSMKICDLASAIAPDMEQKIIGIRPGEKLHESLITAEDARNTLDIGDYYVIKPQVFGYHGLKGKPVPDGFEYSSDNNHQWLLAKDIKEILYSHGYDEVKS